MQRFLDYVRFDCGLQMATLHPCFSDWFSAFDSPTSRLDFEIQAKPLTPRLTH